MLDLLWPVLRAALFSLDAERAHELTLHTLARFPRLLGRLASVTLGPPAPSLSRQAYGLTLPGPVGLAAGLDKNGVAIPFWEHLGFGSIEVGTVTAHPQPGNPRPRMFRLKQDRALLNRMGFNNEGSDALARRMRTLRLADRWPSVPVGANIGKSKVTPLEEAHEDYRISARRLAGLADWFTVNVSSPNTPGLRNLQGRDHLERILTGVLEEVGATPVLLKLAPDLDDDALAEAVELACELRIGGIVATNTTIGREGLTQDPREEGGLSGAPLWPLARHKIGVALAASAGRLPVVGVGGISTANQAQDLLDAGCCSVQLYSGFIYEGPGLPTGINRALEARG